MLILYTSNTGSTKRYAQMLSEKLSCEFVEFSENADIPADTEIVFMSWIMSGSIQNYAKVKEKFENIRAVCAVGFLSGTEKLDELKEKNAVTEELFFLPGAFNINNLTGMYKMLMGMAMKVIKSKLSEHSDPKAKEMAEKLEDGFDFVSEEKLQGVIEYLS